MRRLMVSLFVLTVLAGNIPLAIAIEDEPIVATSADIQTLKTCSSLDSKKIRVLREGSKCHLYKEALAIWRNSPTLEDLTSKFPVTTLQTCAGKSPAIRSYILIRDDCKKFHEATTWHRWLKLPNTPEIESVEALNESTALITLKPMAEIPDAPITFFTVTTHPDEVTTRGLPTEITKYYVTGLNEQKTYTFTITATNADGESPVSLESKVLTTPAIPEVIPAGPGLLSVITTAVLLLIFFFYRRFNSALD